MCSGSMIRAQQRLRPKRLLGLYPDQPARRAGRLDTLRALLHHIRNGQCGYRTTEPASEGKRGDEHVGAGQRSGSVVDQHHVDRTRFDVVGEVAQHVVLGGVPAVSALDQFDRRGGQLRRHGLAREVAFAAAIHQHRSRDLRHPCDGLQRPGHHAAAGQRQVRLVAVGADTCAKARGQHHADGVGPLRRTHGRYFGIVQPPPEILISGAGIAGPALAYWLVRRGHRPVLVERTPELRVGGHAVDIRGTALEVIERMGLDTAVRDARTQILTLSAVRPDGVRTYDVALRPMHEARGDREIEIMRDDLVRILFGAVSDDVEVVFGDSVRSLTQDGARLAVEVDRGTAREVDLVVGADGQHSSIRELTLGPERGLTHHLGAYLFIYTVDNLLGLRDRAVLHNEPGRAAAMFTVRGNQRAKVVLLFRSPALDIDFGDPSAQYDVIRRRFTGMGWYTKRLIESLPEAYDFYVDEMSQVRLPRWSTGRVALLGDAAFGPSPMSGQGTSLALIGAFLLAHHLAEEPDPTTAFELWEKGFRPNVELNQALATDGMSTLLPASRFGIFARNQMMRLPLFARFGRGFGGRIERASRAVTLPH